MVQTVICESKEEYSAKKSDSEQIFEINNPDAADLAPRTKVEVIKIRVRGPEGVWQSQVELLQ